MNASRIALATSLVACVFFYFLVFAQFAFLRRIETADTGHQWLQPTMALMGFGGVAGSLLAWRFAARSPRTQRLRLATLSIGCGLVALGSAFTSIPWILLVLATALGLFLGALTVSLIPALRLIASQSALGPVIGLGVGLAYFASNIPAIFAASAQSQCVIAALAVGLMATATSISPATIWNIPSPTPQTLPLPTPYWLGGFPAWGIVATLFALVWLDSAAFYAIQKTDTLKAGSWDGDTRLWTNAVLHLIGAIVAGFSLRLGHLASTLAAAMLCIAGGVACLKFGYGASFGFGASCYVVGISLYSSALVAFGALGGETAPAWNPAKRAAIAFAIAGWIGSGMGIGMAKDLQGVPTPFLAIASVFALSILVLLAWRKNRPPQGALA